MSLKFSDFIVFGLLEDYFPLVTHLLLKVLADLKVLDFFAEHFLYQDLVNVLVMKIVGPTLVRTDFVRLKNFQNVLLLDDNHLFFVHVERVLVVDAILL